MLKHKEMVKLAQRCMEDKEPERWKSRERVDLIGVMVMVLSAMPLLVMAGYFLLLSDPSATLWTEFTVLGGWLILFGGVMSLASGFVLYCVLLSRHFVDWVDYYFERVYDGEK
jgi:hypothetical protein